MDTHKWGDRQPPLMVVNSFVEMFVDLGDAFAEAATAHWLSGILVVAGALITVFASAVFGYLALRGGISGAIRLTTD